MAYIFNDTVAFGDTLNSFPIVIALCKYFNEPVYIYWTNPKVGALFPKKYGDLFVKFNVEIPKNMPVNIKKK